MSTNACVGRHAADSNVVGPAFHEIAAKYKANPDAEATVIASIRDGGVGRWRDVPMPPKPAISQAQAKALAE